MTVFSPPSPPRVMVGRSAELERLGRMLDHTRMAVVSGMKGLGKSALVAKALADRNVNGVFWISCAPAQTLETLAERIGAMLPEAMPEPSWEGILEYCERTSGWVVVDDAQHLSDDGLNALCSLIQRGARHSRWIVVSERRLASPHVLDQQVLLDPMDDVSLTKLLTELGQGHSQKQPAELIAAAAGSPARLRHLAAGVTPENPLVGELPADLKHVGMVVSVFRAPIALDSLLALADCDEAAVNLLVRYGLVLFPSRGKIIAQPALRRDQSSGQADYRLSLQQVESKDPGVIVEQLFAAGAAKQFDVVREKLSQEYARVLQAGFIEHVWELAALYADELGEVRFRIAKDYRSQAAVRWALSAPRPLSRDAILDLAELMLTGVPGPAGAKLAQKLLLDGDETAELGSGEVMRLTRQQNLIAQCRIVLGDAHGAAEVLKELLGAIPDAPTSTSLRARTLLAHTLCRLGSFAEAESVLAPVMDAQLAVNHGEQTADLVASLVMLGRLYDAEDVFDREVTSPTLTRRTLLSGVRIKAERGRLREARALLERLDSRLGLPALEEFWVRWNTAWLNLLDACGEKSRREISDLFDGALSLRSADGYAWTLLLDGYFRLVKAESLPNTQWPKELGAPEPRAQLYLQTLGHLTGHGHIQPDASAPYDARVFSELAGARMRAQEPGALPALLEQLDGASRSARSGGWVILEMDAEIAAAEICMIHDQWRDAQACVHRLKLLAERVDARRYLNITRWLDFAAQGALNLCKLWPFLRDSEVSPVAARRSLRLVDPSFELPAYDSSVCASVTQRSSLNLSRTGHGPIQYGLDFREKVLLRDDEVVSLKEHDVSLALLACLVDKRGLKEELCRVVWGVQSFHPLRDLKRLQVAIGRLRQLIERTPAAPELILTTTNGYELAEVGMVVSR